MSNRISSISKGIHGTWEDKQFNGDIVHVYSRVHKESLEKNRKIAAVQKRARRKVMSLKRELNSNSKDSKTQATDLRLPPLNASRRQGHPSNRDEELNKRAQRQSTDKSNFSLPILVNPKPNDIHPGMNKERHKHRAVLDPRFEGLMSSLIEVPKQYSQIQRFAPPRRKNLRSIIG